jgi:glycosyltransferase involved in cell wall biosynthesis
MTKNITISVVMAAFNAEKFIAEAIRSVLGQTITDFEFIIVNDGSTDKTREIIHSFHDPRIVYLEQQNEGIAIALNRGLTKARGEYIARFDADDICYPQMLEKQYSFIKENISCVIVGSSVDYIDQDGEFIFTYSLPCLIHEEIQAIKKKTCPFIHSSVLYRKDAVLKKGGYNRHAHSFEDHLLWLAILEEGEAFNLSESLIKVRLNPGSITIDEKWRPKQFHRIKTKVLRKKNITEQEGEELLRIIQGQSIKEIKEGAYHALLAKKFLWNNYQPAKARDNLKKVIIHNRLHWKSYCLFFISFLPELVLQWCYKLVKSKWVHPLSLLKQK